MVVTAFKSKVQKKGSSKKLWLAFFKTTSSKQKEKHKQNQQTNSKIASALVSRTNLIKYRILFKICIFFKKNKIWMTASTVPWDPDSLYTVE